MGDRPLREGDWLGVVDAEPAARDADVDTVAPETVFAGECDIEPADLDAVIVRVADHVTVGVTTADAEPLDEGRVRVAERDCVGPEWVCVGEGVALGVVDGCECDLLGRERVSVVVATDGVTSLEPDMLGDAEP